MIIRQEVREKGGEETDDLKLYKVTCRGMKDKHGIAYVIASDPLEALRKMRKDLDDRDIGFRKDRVLNRIELIAEDEEYPDCGTRLYAT